MEEARNSLADFILDEKPLFVPVDERALSGQVSPTSAKTTDWYSPIWPRPMECNGPRWIKPPNIPPLCSSPETAKA